MVYYNAQRGKTHEIADVFNKVPYCNTKVITVGTKSEKDNFSYEHAWKPYTPKPAQEITFLERPPVFKDLPPSS